MPPGAAATAAAGGGDPQAAKLEVWKQALYERVKETSRDNDLFSQDELLQLDVIPNKDLRLLAQVVQSLSNDKLFVTMREASGQVLWKWRDAQEAHKYKQCASDEQSMVYSLIDDSGGDGIWSQTLQRRLNMNDTVLKNTLKQLSLKGLIAPFKSVEHPNKKMYIKASIQPSDRATGGPWYTDQNLDEAFIEEVQKVIFDYVKMKSSYQSKGGSSAAAAAARAQDPKKGVIKGTSPAETKAASGKKRDASEITQSPSRPAKPSTAVTSATTTTTRAAPTMLPLPAGYTNYPTVRDLARMLSASGITGNTILSEQDVKKLVDVLVWDNLLEPVRVAGRHGYRVVRVAKQSARHWAGNQDPAARDGGGPEPYVSAYTEAPCGRCPVFDICEEGGPVGPSNCEYFQRWLGLS